MFGRKTTAQNSRQLVTALNAMRGTLTEGQHAERQRMIATLEARHPEAAQAAAAADAGRDADRIRVLLANIP